MYRVKERKYFQNYFVSSKLYTYLTKVPSIYTVIYFRKTTKKQNLFCQKLGLYVKVPAFLFIFPIINQSRYQLH